jgi:hypothetical protein
MTPTTTLHLGDTDMLVFLSLINKKMERVKQALFDKGLSSSQELEELADLKAQFLKSTEAMTSFNTF